MDFSHEVLWSFLFGNHFFIYHLATKNLDDSPQNTWKERSFKRSPFHFAFYDSFKTKNIIFRLQLLWRKKQKKVDYGTLNLTENNPF